VQDSHAIGQPKDHVHVVLDDEDRERAIQAGDELGDARGLDRRHTGGRLVEEENARALRERDREFELATLAMRECAHGDVLTTGETDALEHRLSLRVLGARRRTKHAVGSTARRHRERDVLSSRERREQLGPLIHVREPEARALPRSKSRDVLPREPHRAA
jgi:hypothetical protein